MNHDYGLRPCARGRHCRNATLGDYGQAQPALTTWAFCDRCAADIARVLETLPDRYTELGYLLTTQTRTGGTEKVTVSKAAPSLIDLEVERLMVNIGALVGSWEERVRLVAGLDPAPVDVSWGDRPAIVARACGVLGRFVPTLIGLGPEPMRRALDHDDLGQLPEDILGVVRPGYGVVYPDLSGADAGRELLWLGRRAEVMTGQTVRVIALDGAACPGCGLMMLTRRAGEDSVSCRACLVVMPVEDYTDHVGRLVEEVS